MIELNTPIPEAMTEPVAGRVIAVGDVHGCAAALTTLLDAIRPGPNDLVIAIGDVIDYGPDTRGVALIENGENGSERRFIAKRDAKTRTNANPFGQRFGHSVIQLTMDRAVDDNADKPRFRHGEHLGI